MRNPNRISLSEVFHFPGEGGGPGDRTRRTLQRGTGVPSSGDPGNRGSFQQRSRGRCPTWGLEELNTLPSGRTSLQWSCNPGFHQLRKMNPELLSFLSSLVGGRTRLRHPFTNPFSSPVPSWGNVPKADSEMVPMAPLRRLCSCFFDDGPRSEIREGGLANMRRKYAIHPSVGMTGPNEFERATDGGAGEVAVYEAYLEEGFRGVIPSLIDEVSSFFGCRPSQLTPLTWRTLMAIQVLGELHGSSIEVHEILYSYYFSPLVNKDGFYHHRSRDGAPLVEEPSRGVRDNHPFGDGWNSRYVFVKIQEPVGYPTSWRTVDKCVSPGFLCWRGSGEAYNGNSLVIPLGDLSGLRCQLSTKAQKRRLSYNPPLRLARAALSAGGLSSISPTSAEIMSNRNLLVGAHEGMAGEAHRSLDPEKEYQRHLFLSGGFNHRSENLSQDATPRSVIGSRFSEGPSF
ncbi:hypothetical protein F2Q69_00012604 [Brassica cretica]|uniref:Uncharacterized protein n=1 Tax=Brassica cretica TaxID=69181 RepID=A0A8S9QQ74_BRACR|nr:hypothetical protein F2Q69_00012604 [Brassica cretica]